MRTRRDFLKFAAMAAGAGLNGWFPESIAHAQAIDPEVGSTWMDAEHIVILMQENRSFDHTFGMLRGVRGFSDPRALRLPNGNSVFVQTDANGDSYAPWRLDIKDTRITWMGSLPHSRNSQIDAWNGGRHDGWLDAKRSDRREYFDLPLTMGHYTRKDLPFYYALADAFTVCDQNYCSVLSSTSPNRCYLWTGTIRDRQRTDSKIHLRNEQIDDGGLTWKTFPERLQEAGIEWKIYQNELTRSGLSGEADAWLSNFSDNTLECFDAYNVQAYAGFPQAAQLWLSDLSEKKEKLAADIASAKTRTKARQLEAMRKQVQERIGKIQNILPRSGEARYQQLSDAERSLFHAAFVTNAGDHNYRALCRLEYRDGGTSRSMMVPKGDVLHQFRTDVEQGKLPSVSWLVASENYSDHPSAPWYGAWYVSEVMHILTSNPEIWKKTIFILTYDENDGYFDHAPSFVAADPRRPETGGASAGLNTGLEYAYKVDELAQGVADTDARSGPVGLGFRVPMIVASPWSRGGWVNSQLFDHTSTLMLLERFVQAKYGKVVREENISAWRRAILGDLSSTFRPYDPKEPTLEWLDRSKFVVGIEEAREKEVPSNYQRLTREQIEQINGISSKAQNMPHQEEGIRPACGLPYELYADGNVTEDGMYWELRLSAGNQVHGSASAGAPFNVYLRNLKNGGFQAATFSVKAGDTLVRKLPLSGFIEQTYAIEVLAPNGFYRAFSGRVAPQNSIDVRASYEQNGSGLTGNLQIHLCNARRDDTTVTIVDCSYGKAAVRKDVGAGEEATISLPLQSSNGWYDFRVRAEGSDAEVRYAGHIETGRPSSSDPLIGLPSSRRSST